MSDTYRIVTKRGKKTKSMDNNSNNNVIQYFNLNDDGDTAIVRLLHTSVNTIEKANLHWISSEGKNKNVKCIGENCPLCLNNASVTSRIFIHLWDYSDGVEKVWSRTDKILSQFADIQRDWGKLNDCVLRITRKGKQFPKYDVNVLNASIYPPVSADLIDMKVAYRFYSTRSAEELDEYLRTGVLPAKKKSTFVPKEEYYKNGGGSATRTPFVPQGLATRPAPSAPVPPQAYQQPSQGSIRPAIPQQSYPAVGATPNTPHATTTVPMNNRGATYQQPQKPFGNGGVITGFAVPSQQPQTGPAVAVPTQPQQQYAPPVNDPFMDGVMPTTPSFKKV